MPTSWAWRQGFRIRKSAAIRQIRAIRALFFILININLLGNQSYQTILVRHGPQDEVEAIKVQAEIKICAGSVGAIWVKEAVRSLGGGQGGTNWGEVGFCAQKPLSQEAGAQVVLLCR